MGILTKKVFLSRRIPKVAPHHLISGRLKLARDLCADYHAVYTTTIQYHDRVKLETVGRRDTELEVWRHAPSEN